MYNYKKGKRKCTVYEMTNAEPSLIWYLKIYKTRGVITIFDGYYVCSAGGLTLH